MSLEANDIAGILVIILTLGLLGYIWYYPLIQYLKTKIKKRLVILLFL